jgi:hypothetical protein
MMNDPYVEGLADTLERNESVEYEAPDLNLKP